MCDNGYNNKVICPSGVDRIEVLNVKNEDDVIYIVVNTEKTNPVIVNEYVGYIETKFPNNRIVLTVDGIDIKVKHNTVLTW